MKKYLLTVVLFLSCIAVFAGAPESLKVKGSALVDYTSEAPMQRMQKKGNTKAGGSGDKDREVLSTEVYEIITTLKAGDLTFEGATVPKQTITGEEGPYRVRVDFSGATPVVSTDKITKVLMWAPWNVFDIVELKYIGNSQFKAKNILCNTSVWGDDRYRIKVFTDSSTADEETYGQHTLIGDKNDPAYGNMLQEDNNDQWPAKDTCFAPDDKYKNSNLAFNITVTFKSDAIYFNTITDYDPNEGGETGMADISGDFSIYLAAGSNDLVIDAANAGFSIDLISITGSNFLKEKVTNNYYETNISNLAKGVYLVKVTQAGATYVQRIVKQ